MNFAWLRAVTPHPELSIILRRLSATLLAVSLVTNLSLLLLFTGGIKAGFVLSNSMEPAFGRGDLLFISVSDTVVHVDDVVAYEAVWSDPLVTHRVVEIYGDKVIAKGDANDYSDPVFPVDQIRGVVVAVYPFLGWFVNSFTLISLIVAGVILEMLATRWEYLPKHSREFHGITA